MSKKYKFADNDKIYFVSFVGTNWIDLFIKAERMNGILKYEFGLVHTIPHIGTAHKMVKEPAEVYNKECRHRPLNLVSKGFKANVNLSRRI